MSIQYKYGEGEVKALAERAGKAQAANQALQMRFQKDMALMDYQFKLAAEQRARAWELEKMEIASRNDFAQMEQQRVQKQQEFDIIAKAINETDQISEEEKPALLLKNQIKILGGYLPEESMTPYQEQSLALQKEQLALRQRELETDPMFIAAEELKRKRAAAAGGVQIPGQTPTAPVESPRPIGLEAMKRMVPLSQVPPADIPMDEQGKFIIFSPDGQKGRIAPSEFMEYANKGFMVKPISGGVLHAFFPGWKPEPPTELFGIGFGGAGNVPQKSTKAAKTNEDIIVEQAKKLMGTK